MAETTTRDDATHHGTSRRGKLEPQMGHDEQDGPSGPVPSRQQLDVPALQKRDVVLVAVVVQEVILDGDVPAQTVWPKDLVTEPEMFLNVSKRLGQVVPFATQKTEEKSMAPNVPSIVHPQRYD